MAATELEILFEYQGSRKPLCRLKREHVIQVVKEELPRFGDAATVVQLSGEGCRNIFLLSNYTCLGPNHTKFEPDSPLHSRDINMR